MNRRYIYAALSVLCLPAFVFAADKFDTKLVNQLKGSILLQVQQHGEAWYVNPADGKKYYMKDGAAAYSMMRKFGKGITDADLDKIPTGVLEGYFATPVSKATSNTSSTGNQNGIITKNIHDQIDVETLRFNVNSVTETSVVSDIFGSKVAKPGAKFIVVNLDVMNLTKGKTTFPYKGLSLMDNQSRAYEAYSDSIGYTQNYLIGRDLSPSILENGTLTYEIPNDATGYYIVVGTGKPNEFYKVILK